MKIIKKQINLLNKKLKDCVVINKGVAFKSVDFIDFGVPVVKATNIKNLKITEPTSFLSESFLILNKKQILEKEDIILSSVGSQPTVKESAVGQIGFYDKNIVSLLNQNSILIRAKNLNKKYLFYKLTQKDFRFYLDRIATGTANHFFLKVNEIGKYNLFIHEDNKDQDKIASVLSKQEEQVNNIKLLIEKLEKRNQYYAERLLSGELRVREGDNGKVEFYENTEWKDCYVNGQRRKIPIDAKVTTLSDNYKDLNKKGKEGLKGYLEIGDIDIYTKTYNLSEKNKLSVNNCKIVPKDTLLISTVRPTRRCFTISKEEIVVSNAFVRFYIGKDKYPLHIINTIDFSTFCERFAEGGTYPVIKPQNIEHYEYLILPEKDVVSNILNKLIKEKNNLIKLLEKEQKRFDWMSDALLSGEYQIVD